MVEYAPGEIRLKIQELVGNPDAVRKKSKVERHKYYKRPGKGHNRDNCDACEDAGDIICCDSCPASFHLACVDPPLEEDDLPTGGWKCRACSTQKGRSTKAVMPSLEKHFFSIKAPDEEANCMFNLFRILGEHWRKQNPKKFVLPSDFANYEPRLPGYSKQVPVKKPKTKFNISTEPDLKITTRRTTVCFSCDKSSRKGVLLQCDYCPAYYHLDCLEPPLATVPSGYWICPLHVQPFLESKYLTSSALSERMRVWDMAEKQTTAYTALVNFATAVHCQIPKPNNTLILPEKPRVRALPMIDEIYAKFRGGVSEIDEKPKIRSDLETSNISGAGDSKRKYNQSAFAKLKSEFVKLPLGELLKTGDDENKSGFDLLLEAADLSGEESVLDDCLRGISPQMLKLLALSKLAEFPNIAATHQLIDDKDGVSELAGAESEPIRKKSRLEPTIKLAHLNQGKLLEFHRRSIEIGTGGTAHLDLQKLGPCVSTSRRHAAIYFDSIRSQWELLNYGEQGSLVNGLLYGCDTTVYSRNSVPQDETLRSFKEIVDNKRRKLGEMRNPRESFSAILGKEASCACACLKSKAEHPTSCWEGSAIIRKGDQLQFGCHKFLVVDTVVAEKVIEQ